MSSHNFSNFSHDKGAGMQDRAGRLESKMQSLIDQPVVDLQEGSHGLGHPGTTQFPARLIPKDPYDTTYQTKMEQLHANTNMYGKDVQLHAVMDKEDFSMLDRKREISNHLAFQKWMTQAIDMSNPTEGTRSGSSRKSPKGKAGKAKTRTKLKAKLKPFVRKRSGAGKAKRGSR